MAKTSKTRGQNPVSSERGLKPVYISRAQPPCQNQFLQTEALETGHRKPQQTQNQQVGAGDPVLTPFPMPMAMYSNKGKGGARISARLKEPGNHVVNGRHQKTSHIGENMPGPPTQDTKTERKSCCLKAVQRMEHASAPKGYIVFPRLALVSPAIPQREPGWAARFRVGFRPGGK